MAETAHETSRKTIIIFSSSAHFVMPDTASVMLTQSLNKFPSKKTSLRVDTSEELSFQGPSLCNLLKPN
ncbi:uncharacterized protein EI90DRAFT_3076685 [Cantharellus anzutake]|uniref:uncharacterized protein n=1 Tax=Cantharellus anzutake TaxID=1750568 RepID=UPI0019031183|nr:uncharacterized protein EI90DRAFT_3076685 [Cantharellus anzutake]KAF8323649.1 hypothetical protein EI90DRAFT_3076685 [Cantharellus anzutake]